MRKEKAESEIDYQRRTGLFSLHSTYREYIPIFIFLRASLYEENIIYYFL